MNGAKYAFDNFKSDVASIVAGTAPFKIFPQGVFYRDDRVLDITEQRLREMEGNFKSGLPRFKVPINEDHAGIGKIGNILDVEYRQGDGLYATKYEFTDEGKKLLQEGRYDAVSGEVIWTLNGGKYQDPQTGEYRDNVLTGLAICDQPFFGHSQVALFSANKKEPSLIEQIKVAIQETFADLKKKPMADEEETEPTDNPEEEDKEKMPMMKGKQSMADKNETVVDTYDAKAEVEKLTAQLNQKQEEFAAQLKAEKERADTFAAQLATEQKNRELFAYTQEAQSLTSLPIKADEYADTMYSINKADPKLAKWVKEKFAQFDTMIAQGALFSTISRNTSDQSVETLETAANKILAEEFDGNAAKYSEAYILAGKRNPALIPAEMRSRKIRQ